MRRMILPMLATVAMIACGGVDDPPLGGPYGGTTNPTDPNGGQPGDPNNTNSNTNNNNNNNTNTGSDAGSTNTTQKDSGSTTTTKDSGTTQTQQDSGTTQTNTNAPTWTQIFNNYLAGSTKGRCSSCHSQGSSKANLYSWLQGKGYISGTSSALVDSNQSCLVWYGGNMPTSGVSSWPQAVTDMNAWAAAGALNN